MTSLTIAEKFFGWLLQTTWQAAVIAALILVAQYFLRKRLSPAWRYGLWLLLVARLVMPAAPPSAFSVFNLAKAAKSRPAPAVSVTSTPVASEPPALTILQSAPVETVQPVPAVPMQPTPKLDPAAISSPTPLAAKPTPSAKPINWMSVATCAWLAGAMALLLRFCWINLQFRRRLAHFRPVTDPALTHLLTQCAASLRVNSNLAILETDEVETPAVYCLWQKRILLPTGLRQRLSTGELRHVLLHELAHLKRRDPELNWLLSILQILHWFNPLLWFAFGRIHADRELATDDLALAHSGQHDRTSYGETVLKLLEGLTQRRAVPAVIGIGESKSQMAERIRAIARGSVGPRWRWLACTAALVIAGVSLTSARDDAPKGINLLERYPTTLKAGDTTTGRNVEFTPADIYEVSRFKLEVGKELVVETGPADVGIGHCADGVVCAVLIPRKDGKLTSSVAPQPETIANVWLRMHPAEINRIFPPETVLGPGRGSLANDMMQVAKTKATSSWHIGGKATIPPPKDMTVDVDTQAGPRRFFAVDTDAKTANYIDAFASRPVNQPIQNVVDTNYPSVVSVSPANGAQDLDLAQEIHVRFDRPMNPSKFKLEWTAGGFQLNGSIRVTDDHQEFILPVRLTPGKQQLAVNPGASPEYRQRGYREEGFSDTNGTVANAFRWSFSTRPLEPKPGAPKPRVVNVSPASGTTTPMLNAIQIAFDQPMLPPDVMLPFLKQRKPNVGENSALIPSIEYNPTTRQFTVPVLLQSEDDVRVTLQGFYSAQGVECDPIVLHYQTSSQELSASYLEQAKAAASNPDLRKVLTGMKESLTRFKSGVENVQTISTRAEKGAYNHIEATLATFKWQGSDQIYADISGPMQTLFIFGSDGKTCWLCSQDNKSEKRAERIPAAQTRKDFELHDPFGLATASVQEVQSSGKVLYAGQATLEGRPCYRLQKWEVSQNGFLHGTLTQWWVDQETFLLKQTIQCAPDGQNITRFDYSMLNQPLPDSAFAPLPGWENAKTAEFLDKEPVPGEQRYLRIHDGADGRMSGRIGTHLPNGSHIGSGLN